MISLSDNRHSGSTQPQKEGQTEPDMSAPDNSGMVISNFERSSHWVRWCISFQHRVSCQQLSKARCNKLKQKRVVPIIDEAEEHSKNSNVVLKGCQYFYNEIRCDLCSAGYCNPCVDNCQEPIRRAVSQEEHVMEVAFVKTIKTEIEYDIDATSCYEKANKAPYSFMHVYKECVDDDLSSEPVIDESYESDDDNANIRPFSFMEVSSEHSEHNPQTDLDFYSDADMDEITSNEDEDIAFEYNDSCDESELEFDIIFDEEFDQEEEIQETDTTNLPLYFQSCSSAHLFQSINTSFDEISDICLDKMLPCITQERISLKATDYLGTSLPTVCNDDALTNVKHCGVEASKVDKENLGLASNTEQLPTSSYIPINSCKKKVSFANDKELETIHLMFKWSFAYRHARKGHWERYACDRSRFQRRIASCAEVLNPVIDRKYQQFVNSLN